jgi:DNA polymerase/3'-5' exonuclease PolX
MKLHEAKLIAQDVLEQLRPHCDRIEIAGSIRREAPEVKDIEIVAIPKPYMVGMFEDGIAKVVNRWECVKGDLGRNCKYTQRILPQGIKLDLFFAKPENWGWIFAIRTESAAFSHIALASRLKWAGLEARDGYLYNIAEDKMVEVTEEAQLFKLLGLNYIEPQFRN